METKTDISDAAVRKATGRGWDKWIALLVWATPATVTVAYRARATRDGSPTYSAYCTSTCVRIQDGWRLVQHQQTPA